ncbi:DgyrCDS721 [Dimorphilus gyrociliatus]|uniref:Cyclin-Q n=1 Tax=Dimorphilus gyrociliatus TaxID=2664684 RepID=A0A7I8V895_9ANNE|nr:DgyrCDS721 [Dimorphilus gyrociliatus]
MSESKVHDEVSLFIREAGLRVRTTVIVIAHATTLYRKFFSIYSQENYDVYTVAVACLYLSGKVCEESVRLRDVINVSYKILHPDKEALQLDDTYWKLRESVTKMELQVLRAIEYEVDVDLPHNYLLYFAKSLLSWLPPGVVSRVPLVKTAWSLLQDSYVTDICMKYPSQHIAVSLFYASLCVHGIHVPLNESAKVEWWSALCEDITMNDIKTIIRKVFRAYGRESPCLN